jgi:hypothetical protein
VIEGLEESRKQGLMTAFDPTAGLNSFNPGSLRAAYAAALTIPAETLADLLTCALEESFVAEGGRVFEIKANNPRGRWSGYSIGGDWSGCFLPGSTQRPLSTNSFEIGDALRVADLPAAVDRALTDATIRCFVHVNTPEICPVCREVALVYLAAANAFVDIDGTWLEPTESYDPFPLDLDYPGAPAGPALLSFGPDAYHQEVVKRVSLLPADAILVMVDLHY